MYSQFEALVSNNHDSESLAPRHGTSVVDNQFAIKTKILEKKGSQEKKEINNSMT